jgi:hypothetical protein
MVPLKHGQLTEDRYKMSYFLFCQLLNCTVHSTVYLETVLPLGCRAFETQ